MRIAFDHQIFGWQEFGGVSRYNYELASELATTYDQDVNVVSPLYVNEYLKGAPGALKVWGMPMRRIPKTVRVVRFVNSLLVKPICSWLTPDIIHETYYSQTRLAPKKSKVVLTVYDMIHERFPESFPALDPTRHEKATAVARADHIICISKQTQQDLVELLNVNPNKTSVVHLGFTLTNDQVEVSEFKTGRPYLLYVGQRRGYKNFDGFLKAVAASELLRKDFRIVCFGGGGLTKYENELIMNLGFAEGDVCQISGSDGVLAGLYQHASVFVYPSYYEGFGIPPLEAMSFSCPVACSNVSSIPEVVGNAGAYFNPTNVDDIKNAIERLITDQAYTEQLIAAGKVRIKAFSWEHCAEETLKVYQKVLR